MSRDEPLLPNKTSPADQNPKTASILGAVFNISTSVIGAGIMSIPATFKDLGVIPAFFLIGIVALIVEVSIRFLVRFTESGDSSTYAGLMGESFGRVGSWAVQISILITNLGCLITYLIIIEDVLSGNQSEGSVHLGVLQEWLGIHWWNTRAFPLLFLLIIVIVPLVLFRHVESLRFSSAVAVLLAMVFVGISSVLAISAVFQGKTRSPKFLPDLKGNASFFHLFTAVPVIVTAFTFHFNVHPIGAEFPKQSDMIPAVRISLVFCSVIYLAVGFFGYLLFGEQITSDILVNFDRGSSTSVGSLVNDIVRLSYALHLVLVFPLLNFSLRANIDELFFPKRRRLALDMPRFLKLTLVLLVLAYLAAIAIPSIWYFFQFMGSTAAVSIAFIFPGAIVLRDVHGISLRRDRVIATIMIVLAVVTSIVAISTNLCTFIM